MVNSAEGLPQRLRSLRVERWSGRRITQGQLAEALGASVPLVSSWESTKNPKIPPRNRLEAYATFFATERSIAKTPYRIITQLTDDERERFDEILAELIALSGAAQRNTTGVPAPAESSVGGVWRFQPDQNVTIVCSEMPKKHLDTMPYTDPEAPDYVALYRYADLDALMELFAHVRMANPGNEVRFRTPNDIQEDELTTHLVLLGGVDWNPITKELLRRLDLPVWQRVRESETEPGGFEVKDEGKSRLISPVLRSIEGREVLDEDVGHFYRAPNPYNVERTSHHLQRLLPARHLRRGARADRREVPWPQRRIPADAVRRPQHVQRRLPGARREPQSHHSGLERAGYPPTRVATP